MTSARIVVGVDGSPASVAALRWGARQAELTGSSLVATISWDYPSRYGIELYTDDWDGAGRARSTLNAAVTEAGIDPAVAARGVVTFGHPALALVEASAAADLLVVGSRGRGGFAGLVLGSVSQYVTAHAHCPVVVVREPEQSSPV